MAGPDLAVLTAAIDFDSVTAALLSVLSALLVVYVTWESAKILLRVVRGDYEGHYDDYTYEDYERDQVQNGLTVMTRDEYEKHF